MYISDKYFFSTTVREACVQANRDCSIGELVYSSSQLFTVPRPRGAAIITIVARERVPC